MLSQKLDTIKTFLVTKIYVNKQPEQAFWMWLRPDHRFHCYLAIVLFFTYKVSLILLKFIHFIFSYFLFCPLLSHKAVQKILILILYDTFLIKYYQMLSTYQVWTDIKFFIDMEWQSHSYISFFFKCLRVFISKLYQLCSIILQVLKPLLIILD